MGDVAGPNPPGLSAAVWVASSRRVLGHAELISTLTALHAQAQADAITGLLLYDEGTLMHAVEGPSSAVDEFLARDLATHTGVMVLHREPTTAREFTAWAMSFRSRDPLMTAVPGYSHYLQGPEADTGSGEVLSQLLQSFRRNLRR